MDYKKLKVTLKETITSLSRYAIPCSSIKMAVNSPLICGGFGDIQLASIRRMGQPTINVAVKKLRPAGNENQRLRVAVALARELKIWSRLNHPHVVPLVGFYLDVQGDVMWLLSQWEPLGNIVEYLAANQPDEETRLNLAIDTADGLNYLHKRKPPLCHGDIKGTNILMNAQKRAMWCDFGLAQAVDDTPTGLTTSNHAGRGTTRYFSPELLEEETPQKTLKSDVWAWACVFVEITASKIPYCAAGSDFLVIKSIAQGNLPTSLKDVKCGGELLEKCWSSDAALRPTMSTCLNTLMVYRSNLILDLFSSSIMPVINSLKI